uniref:Neuromedin Bb n=1 Tax=Xiphophorus couchianus TaxID=32473 RepID=A0A3B5MTI5_9TELE
LISPEVSRMTTICRGGFLSSFILVSYVAMTTSVMLDLTELKNKVSQLKVNPRGNLWATGHFMGKKSVDSSLLETVFENIDAPSEDRDVNPVARVEDVANQVMYHISQISEHFIPHIPASVMLSVFDPKSDS